MPKISVIIPVYNTEKYIEKCLSSILNQTMKNIEIIIVNDGSEDNSEAIIKQFIEKYNNIQIIIKYYYKENGGLSDARNYGVKKATGKYISFIDSDDYIDKDLYKKLEKYMDRNIDLIKFKMQTIDEQGNIIEKLDGPVFEKCDGEEAFSKLCVDDKFMDPACIYLYRREFFMENNFEYKKGTYHEDFGLTSLIILKAKTFVSTEIYGYYYLQSDNSITRDKDYKKETIKANHVLNHYDNMIEIIKGYMISKKTEELVKRYYTNSVILKVNTLKGKERKEYIKQIKQRKLYKNIKPYNLKQFIKRIILKFNINLYLKMR